MKHFPQLVLLPLGGVLLMCGVAHAQVVYPEGHKDFGAGAHGVNRVVRSDSNADDPRLTATGHVELSMVQPVSRAGGFDAEVNPYNNKATGYLGGTSRAIGGGTLEFDGGLQFESGVFGNYTRGWTAFFSRGNQFVTAHIYRDNTDDGIDNGVDVAWRPASSYTVNKDGDKYIAATGSIGSDLAFTIVPGGTCNAMVSAINVDDNTFVWNPNPNNDPGDPFTTANKDHHIAPWGAAAYNSATQAIANVKRVSAMTRSPGHKSELDGSQMSAAWTLCTLDGNVDQSATGFDSLGGDADDAWDRRDSNGKTDASRTITAFSIAGATNAQARSGIARIARYTTETVSVNLGTATTLTGDNLEWE